MTNEEMNEMFNKNIKIAYKIANQYRINYPNEYEDIKQIALLGLWKAVKNYNPKWAFSTIAYRIIFNSINFYIRNVKKHRDNTFSINTIVYEDNNNQMTIEDLLPDNIDYINDIMTNIDIKTSFEKLDLNEAEKYFLYLKKYGLSQKDIGLHMNRSQAQVSRIQNNLRLRFKKNLNGELYSFNNYKPLKPLRRSDER